MKKNKKSIYLRYEFSNEAGKPEGGDIFEFPSLRHVQEMTSQILKVAASDGVAVLITVGQEKPFYGFLKAGGLSRKDVEKELVSPELAPVGKNRKKAASKKKK